MSVNTKNNTDIESYLECCKENVNEHLKELFQPKEEMLNPPILWEAIRYSLLDTGKRIRAALCLAAYESLIELPLREKYLHDCLTVSSSIETIHAMSLIHDDLPSMDNDDLRRGKPSCHKAFGEATAILAGDAMLGLSSQFISENTNLLSDSQKLEIITALNRAFTFGLVPGQILDLSAEGKNISIIDMETIYRLKTAELIRASVLCGAYVAMFKKNTLQASGFSREQILQKFSNYGINIGIAFQIVDDILDLTSDTKTLGKTSGKDAEQKKATMPIKIGIEKSRNKAREYIVKAKTELDGLPILTQYLQMMGDYILNRVN